jgi:REP element-mobilizing transposase RayT
MDNEKYQNKYRIPTARAVWHNYNGGDYFITICTTGKLHYFGEIDNGEMMLNALGQKLDELIGDIKIHNPYCEIPLYQIMPNHVHLIVCIDSACRDAACRDAACHVSTGTMDGDIRDAKYKDAACHVSTGETDADIKRTGKNEKMREIADECGLLSTAIGGLKSALTKYANANKLKFGWQTRFHDHIVRDQDEMNMIASYIENNVTNWENDKFFTK